MSLKAVINTVVNSDVTKRAVKTFVQAFVAQLAVVQDVDRTTVVVSAVAAGVSAAWNGVVSPWLASRKG